MAMILCQDDGLRRLITDNPLLVPCMGNIHPENRKKRQLAKDKIMNEAKAMNEAQSLEVDARRSARTTTERGSAASRTKYDAIDPALAGPRYDHTMSPVPTSRVVPTRPITPPRLTAGDVELTSTERTLI